MRHFYVIANYAKPHTLFCVQEIKEYLTAKGAECVIAGPAASDNGRYHYTDTGRIPGDTQCVIVLGGDGTLIQAAHDLKGTSYPLIGINLGNLGYLSEVDQENLFPSLDRLLMDDFFIEERMTLLGEIVRDGQIVCSDTALNDIVLTRLESMKMLRFSLYVNDQFITRYNADGIIVATPTGSTAYSLSAGGPIVLPTSNLFVLTPICAQTLTTARSIVLPDNAYIRLIVEAKDGIRMLHQAVSFDSDNMVSVHPGDEIVIKSASDKVRLIRLDQRSFLDTLGKKLSR